MRPTQMLFRGSTAPGAGMSGAERILLNVGAVSSALTLMAVAFVAALVMRLPT